MQNPFGRSKPVPIALKPTDRELLERLLAEIQEIKRMVTDDFAALGEQFDTFTASIGPTVAKAVANAEEAKDANAADNLALMQAKLTAAQDALSASTTPAAPAQPAPPSNQAVTVDSVAPNSDGSSTVTYSDGTTAQLAVGQPVPAVGSSK